MASRRAAQRLGFSYEGVFRQALVVKGRNRDTSWFAAIDAEWPALKEAYAAWLSPANFDTNGQQRESGYDPFGSRCGGPCAFELGSYCNFGGQPLLDQAHNLGGLRGSRLPRRTFLG